MFGAVDAAATLWTSAGPLAARDFTTGTEVLGLVHGDVRSRRIERLMDGSRPGTVWLHSLSGAKIRCLQGQRVNTVHKGVRSWRQAKDVMPGHFLSRMVDGILTVDPVIAVTVVEEAAPAVLFEIPNMTLLSEEGFLCRPSRQ